MESRSLVSLSNVSMRGREVEVLPPPITHICSFSPEVVTPPRQKLLLSYLLILLAIGCYSSTPELVTLLARA